MPYNLIDPNETLDFSCDWGPFLDEGGSPSDTISSSEWLITPQEASPIIPVLSGETQSNGGRIRTIFVSNAVYGQIYQLTNRVVTGQGRTADRSWTLQCEHR